MNIMILASSPYSHIIQLEPLVKELLSKNHIVTILSDKRNKDMIENFGANFLNYPQGISPASAKNADYNNIIKEYNTLIENKKYDQAINYFISQDAKAVFDINDKQLKSMIDIIRNLKINLIFRDAVDKFGIMVGRKLNIPTIGYMTHNLYSRDFFEQNEEQLYSLLLDNRNKIPIEYFRGFRNKVDKYFNKYSMEFGYKINSYHQLDPNSEFTILFSTSFIQPIESLNNNRKYLYVYPNSNRFYCEENINLDIQKFIEKYKKIIYISSGTIICQSFSYYRGFIEGFKNNDKIGLVISAGKCSMMLEKYLCDHNILNVLILDSAPQKYILSNSDLFITSGGQNSILESIYFKVPMLVTPLTSEQRLNGYIIERNNFGLTTSKNMGIDKTIGTMIGELIESSKIRLSIYKASEDIKHHYNNFSSMWSYIDSVKNER
ncbi:MAG: glycosyltransferase family 1 protein [Coprobacillus sp.]|jgi:UDP-glucoronosyl and UDP-glucosyl transferase.|nr:glycosyltransferase family 1 protein [Coprobacillus sp.]